VDADIDMPSFAEIAHRLPDIPRWVEVRDLLFAEEGELLGFEDGIPPALVFRSFEDEVAYVVGEPSAKAIIAATINSTSEGTVIVPLENAAHTGLCLPEWLKERIFVYSLKDTEQLPHPKQVVVGLVQRVVLQRANLPQALREELLDAVDYSPLAAVFIEGKLVSFCYAASQTESWWDVSIDTLATYRRQGYAGLCFAYLARHMQTQGKSVVWQSLESNAASWQLALKLGLTPVDELACFRRARTALKRRW
jgi:hypothetical protein